MIDTLRSAIERAKGGDLFAPVTIIVPTHLVGLQLRRELVDRESHDGPGIVNVHFQTPRQLAEFLAGPLLGSDDRIPETDLLRLETLRQALLQTGLESVADHDPSLRQVDRLFNDISKCAGSNLPEGVHELAQILGALRKGVVEMGAVFEEVTSRIRRDTFVELGRLIALPSPPDQPCYEEEFLRRLTDLGIAERLSQECKDSTRECWILPDAEEECRSATAYVMDCARRGTPLDRIAILYAGSELYGRLLLDTLSAARVPHNGRSERLMLETPAGRFLDGLMKNLERGFRRREVIDWLSSTSVINRGQRVLAHQWDRITKVARVTKGLDQWGMRIHQHSVFAQERSENGEEEHRDSALRDVQVCRQILEFLDDVEVVSTELDKVVSWRGFEKWLRQTLSSWLPRGVLEQASFTLLTNELEMLGALEPFCPKPTLSDFRRVLGWILEKKLAARQPFGQGVFVSTLREAFGLQFDTVLILGMTEANLPKVPRHEVFGRIPGLPGAADRIRVERRYFDAIRDASSHLVFSYPRADLRSMREAMPSLWFLEEVAGVTGKSAVYFDELEDLKGVTGIRIYDSFADALTKRPPASIQERNLVELSAGRALLPEEQEKFERGRLAIESRAGELWTPWDGMVKLSKLPRFSASSLESFGKCPFKFFLEQGLKIKADEEIRDVWVIDPLAKGTALHKALHDFYEGHLNRPENLSWNEVEQAEFQAVLDRAFSEMEGKGFVRDSPAWRFATRKLKARMSEFLDRDSRLRLKTGRPIQVEYRFGKPIPLELKIGGLDITVSGSIDRLDFNSTSGVVTVIDYKSGSGSGFTGWSPNNPLQSGKIHQLPIYGEVVRTLLPELGLPENVHIMGDYLLLEPKAKEEVELDLDSLLGAYERNLEAVHHLATAGVFPATPGGYAMQREHNNCRYCNFKHLCPAKRQETWIQKRNDPRVAPWVAVTENNSLEESVDETS